MTEQPTLDELKAAFLNAPEGITRARAALAYERAAQAAKQAAASARMRRPLERNPR